MISTNSIAHCIQDIPQPNVAALASIKDSTDKISAGSGNINKVSDYLEIPKESDKVHMHKYKYHIPSRSHEKEGMTAGEQQMDGEGGQGEQHRAGPFAILAQGEHPLIYRAKKYVLCICFVISAGNWVV